MKTALITTTINVPTVLKHYRALGPDVPFFVAIDEKTPEAAINFCQYDLPDVQVLFIQDQQKWACSELIGWNSIQRRNIALLEAIRWGADLIYSIDDDNIPLDASCFTTQHLIFNMQWEPTSGPGHAAWRIEGMKPWHGLRATALENWFDVGQLLDPVAPHRGMPHGYGKSYSFESVTDARIGVAAGICLGDPDIGAVTRIANSPTVHRVSELLRAGIVVDPMIWTVFNSQNTAFIRELAPAFFMLPGVGRYDDILASLIMQRVMRPRGLHVHFGQPFVWQQRNQHNLVKDLKGELHGMEKIEQFATYLDRIALSAGGSVLGHVREIWRGFDNLPNSYGLVPRDTVDAALAFCDDMEKVL